jgi:hypothetical protein
MKYACLGFFDEAAFAQIPQVEVQSVMEECFAYDDVLRRGGHFPGEKRSAPPETQSRSTLEERPDHECAITPPRDLIDAPPSVSSKAWVRVRPSLGVSAP